MTAFFIIILIISVGLIGTLLYLLHERVEKMSKNQAVMVGWFDTIRQNEETLLGDFKKLQYELKELEKTTNRK